jgi:hypothetical protein
MIKLKYGKRFRFEILYSEMKMNVTGETAEKP